MANEYDKILGEIKKGTDNISGTTQEVQKINSFISDKQGDVKEGFKNLMSKLDALKTLQGWDSSIQKIGTSPISSKTIGDIASNVGTIANHAESISQQVTEMTGFLKTIKEKIEGFTSIYPSGNNVSNASGSTNAVDGIHDTVKKIYTLLGAIKQSVDEQVNNGTTGDPTLDALIKENRIKKEELQRKENSIREEESLRRRYEKKGFKEVEAEILAQKLTYGKHGQHKVVDEKTYLKYLREKDKESEKRREKIKNRHVGASKWVGGVTDVINSTGILSKEKPSASAIADKGIGMISKAGLGGQIAGAVLQIVKNLFDLASKNDKATSDFARTIGGNHVAKVNVGESVASMIRDLNWKGDKFAGYRMEDAFSAMTEIAEARGRTTERMDAQTLRSAIDLRRFGIGGEAINNFDTFGKSIEETDRYFTKLYGEVSKKGLSFKNVSKAVNDNLKMAQSHTFTNGLRGLERMAEKSVQLKYNMQQVFQFAEKVSDLEEAIKTSANLSVLGGNFAQFSNPMQLLYEGLNDTEALNDRILKMFSGKAYWDKDKKEMNMSALDREFIKQAAKSAGLDPSEMLNMAFNEGKVNRIGKQITPGVSKDVADYIKNVAELDENGNAFVTFGSGHTQQRVSVDELSDANKEQLQKEVQAREEKNAAKLGDIWQNTSNIGEQMDNLLSFLQEKLGMWVYQLFVTLARNENKRRTIAEGEGSDELKAKRRQLYESEAINKNGFWGKRKTWAKEVAALSEEEIDRRLEKIKEEKEKPQGSSPGGFMGKINGASHWFGGVLGKRRGQYWEAEDGETLINKNSSARYGNVLSKIQNGTFNPYSYANSIVKNDMNKMFQPLCVAGSQNQAATHNNGQVGNNNVSGTIKVDIPQTITINIAGGGKIGDYDIRPIIMKYVDEIMKEAQMRKSFSGFDKENFYNQSGMIFGA